MSAVQVNQFEDRHDGALGLRGKKLSASVGGSTPRRARSSVVYERAAWFASREYPILRALFLTALTVLTFLRFGGAVLTLLVLGQFVEIAVAWRQYRRARRRGPSIS